MKGLLGQVSIVAVIIGIVTAVIGFVIVDEVMTPATQATQGNLNNFTGNATLGVGNPLIEGSLVAFNATGTPTFTVVTDYNITYSTGAFVMGHEATIVGGLWNVTYLYQESEYFNSSLSRTIGVYVVPLGLLGVLAMAAFLAAR